MITIRRTFASFACMLCPCVALAQPDIDSLEVDEVEVVEVEEFEPSPPALGLQWIADQQRDDGSWAAQPARGDEKRNALSSNHATGLALLAYLGAGQTHDFGMYQKTVSKGLAYLERQMSEADELGDLRGEGDLEGHAVAALAMVNAFAMNERHQFLVPAQLAVRFSERHQNSTGGWGKQPSGPDDMHIVGWHLLTVRSAWLSGLLTREETLPRLSKYLDGQQVEGGRYYGRKMRSQEAQATAIGLLARAHIDWPKEDERWSTSAKWLVEHDPGTNDIERTFWITFVARQAGDDDWKKWHDKLRPHLEKEQIKTGPHKGSWFDARDRSAERGRLYQTILNVMCFEIYYRHLMVYRNNWDSRPSSITMPENGKYWPADDLYWQKKTERTR